MDVIEEYCKDNNLIFIAEDDIGVLLEKENGDIEFIHKWSFKQGVVDSERKYVGDIEFENI